LGIISSVLGEVKFFLPASLAILGLGAVIFIIQTGQFWKLGAFVVLIGTVFLLFIAGYNTFVPGADRIPLETYLLDSETLNVYTNALHRSSHHESDVYHMGRSLAIKYGWETINRDPLTLFFGLGIGARAESVTLGTAGLAYGHTSRIMTRRSSLLVLMQEMGILGLIAVVVYIFWITNKLIGDIRRDPHSPAVGLRYGLILFTLLWPIWLWYSTFLNHEVAMMLYWISLGYVLGLSKRQQDRIIQPINQSLESRYINTN
jgi:hypothetical protein